MQRRGHGGAYFSSITPHERANEWMNEWMAGWMNAWAFINSYRCGAHVIKNISVKCISYIIFDELQFISLQYFWFHTFLFHSIGMFALQTLLKNFNLILIAVWMFYILNYYKKFYTDLIAWYLTIIRFETRLLVKLLHFFQPYRMDYILKTRSKKYHDAKINKRKKSKKKNCRSYTSSRAYRSREIVIGHHSRRRKYFEISNERDIPNDILPIDWLALAIVGKIFALEFITV